MKFIILILIVPISCFSQKIKFRKYQPGEKTVYRLTGESYYNDAFSSKSVSLAQLIVLKDSAGFTEEISWLKKTQYTKKDTLLLDSVANKIAPYKISLMPGSKVLLPKLDNAEMVGEITDLNTFFVAASPAMKMQELSGKNPKIINEKIAEGNFAEGKKIVKGADCIQVTQTLLKTTRKYTLVQTDFLPPASFCLSPLLDTVRSQLFSYPNNFQMVQRAGNDNVNFMWGNEFFSVVTKVDNKDGKILEAAMTNTLNLRMRVNASPDLKKYAIEMPFKIYRTLKLELISNEK